MKHGLSIALTLVIYPWVIFGAEFFHKDYKNCENPCRYVFDKKMGSFLCSYNGCNSSCESCCERLMPAFQEMLVQDRDVQRIIDPIITAFSVTDPTTAERLLNVFIPDKDTDNKCYYSVRIGQGYKLQGKIKDAERVLDVGVCSRNGVVALLSLSDISAE